MLLSLEKSYWIYIKYCTQALSKDIKEFYEQSTVLEHLGIFILHSCVDLKVYLFLSLERMTFN